MQARNFRCSGRVICGYTGTKKVARELDVVMVDATTLRVTNRAGPDVFALTVDLQAKASKLLPSGGTYGCDNITKHTISPAAIACLVAEKPMACEGFWCSESHTIRFDAVDQDENAWFWLELSYTEDLPFAAAAAAAAAEKEEPMADLADSVSSSSDNDDDDDHAPQFAMSDMGGPH